MPYSRRFGSTLAAMCAALALMVGAESSAQHSNPYRAFYGWAKLPEGRTLGVVAGFELSVATVCKSRLE